jgi:hypothetical protein
MGHVYGELYPERPWDNPAALAPQSETLLGRSVQSNLQLIMVC